MCLDKLTYKEEPKIGYKSFSKRVGERITYHPAYINNHAWPDGFKRGVWYVDQKTDLEIGSLGYPAGFHLFKTITGATTYKCSSDVVCKIEYMAVVAEGKQYAKGSYYKTLVAKMMRIIEEVEVD